MVKPKAGEVKGIKKRAASVTPKKQPAMRSQDKDVQRLKIADGRPKPVSKKITVTELKEKDRKIEIIKNITKRDLPKERRIQTPGMAVLASRINLALMIPFRTSVNQPQLVSNVARYAGTMFVVLGAFFTLYNMSAALAPNGDLASLTAQTTTGACVSGTDCYTNTTSGSPNTTTFTTQDPTPDVDIKVESSSNILTSTVPVNVTVSYANRVDLLAYHKDTKAVTQIGTLTHISDSVWRTYWRTTGVDDGTYRLKAIVTNQYGTYSIEDSTDYIVANHPIDVITSTTTGTDGSSSGSSTGSNTTSSSGATTTTETNQSSLTTATTSADTVITPTTSSLIRVSLGMNEPLKGVVSVRTLVEGAAKLPLYIRKTNSTVSTLLGYATLHSTGEWRYSWDTVKLPDGDYDLRVQALFPNGASDSQTLFQLTIKNSSTETASSSVTAVTAPTTTTTVLTPFKPEISIMLAKSNPLSGQVDVYINSSPLDFVELYALPEKSLTPRFIGLAQKQSDNTSWKYRMDTINVPNGYYDLFVRARHQYGDSESSRVAIRIYNEEKVEQTAEEVEYVETLKSAGTEVETLTIPEDQYTDSDPDSLSSVTPYAEPVLYTTLRDQVDEEFEEETDALIEEFKLELKRIMDAYSMALRANDEEKVRSLQNELEQLRERVVNDLPMGDDRTDVVTRINEILGSIIKDVRERIERSETIIRERVGEAITKDSDSDGISDYDEVNLYDTDPFSSDTDQDGFIDGIEVLNGYDPKDDTSEANVQYESPREQGVVREDLLTIDYITTVDTPESTELPKAQIAGKALPNSFVTLYIFSTPIVVTVKSDSDGNWNYIFDKELENGEHEMYIGMTDNAGKIVAKSNPLSFVKTAEAFTPIDAEASAVITTVPNEPSLISSNVLLIIGSLAVVSLGLVLILLGLHVRPKEPELQTAS